MMLKLKQVVLTSALILSALPALAQDVALVIGNRSYSDQQRIRNTTQVRNSVRSLETAGFRVFYGQDLDSKGQFRLAGKFQNAIEQADRVVVLLGGHIASSNRDSWLLSTDSKRPNIFTIGRAGLSIGAVMEAAGQKPGGALVLLGQDGVTRVGKGMNSGLGDLDIPQGVTVIKGPISELVPLLTQGFLEPGTTMAEVIRNAPRNVTSEGFLPATMSFLPLPSYSSTPPAVGGGEYAYWDTVQAIGTVDALQSYIQRYPNGRYADHAREMIEEQQSGPEDQARATEKSLKLNREQRRQIQRNLSILGFNPRGVDGVFGPGSRAAIGAWQQSRRIDGYGYLTGNQVASLQAAADQRSHELEEEARRRQEEQDRADATYWRKTGRNGTEAGLRAYLRRYPDGLYSEIARERVRQLEDQYHDRAAEAESEYWDSVQSNGSAEAYQSYLAKYPRGVFVRTARDRLEYLKEEQQQEGIIRSAQLEESRVAGNGIARLLVEKKLHALGLKPGRVDGKFDEDTRRAVRRFQRARQIPVTGYVTQQTIVQLLAKR